VEDGSDRRGADRSDWRPSEAAGDEEGEMATTGTSSLVVLGLLYGVLGGGGLVFTFEVLRDGRRAPAWRRVLGLPMAVISCALILSFFIVFVGFVLGLAG
jgi:hypothetical protein